MALHASVIYPVLDNVSVPVRNYSDRTGFTKKKMYLDIISRIWFLGWWNNRNFKEQTSPGLAGAQGEWLWCGVREGALNERLHASSDELQKTCNLCMCSGARPIVQKLLRRREGALSLRELFRTKWNSLSRRSMRGHHFIAPTSH